MADERFSVELEVSATNRISGTANAVLRDLGRMDDALEELQRENTRLQRSMQQMGTVIQGALAGVSLGAVVSFTSEMNELGSSVNRAEAVFTELGGNIETMRAATRGAVDDLTLMQGANRLLLTGLAETSEQAADLTRVAVTLGGALGQDAAGAIENFNAALLNNSYERLDSLGISAGAVRDRVEELKEAGMEMSAAFRTAVLEQSEVAIANLGDAALMSSNSIDRLGVRWDNLVQDVASAVNTTLTEAANTLEMLFTLGEGVIRQQQADAAEARSAEQEAFARGTVIAEQFIAGYETALTPEAIREITRNALQALQDDPTLDLYNPDVTFSLLPDSMVPGWSRNDEWQQQTAFLLGYIRDQNALMEEAARLNQRNLDIEEARGMAVQALTGWWEDANRFTSVFMDEIDRAGERGRVMDMASRSSQQLRGLFDPNAGFIGDVQLFDPDNLAMAQQLAAEYEYALERAEELNERGIISDAQLEMLKAGAGEVKELADQAERGAAAFEKMSLSQIFGQTGGGLLGEVSDRLVEYMESQGFDEATIANVREQFDFSSGRVTELSRAFEEDFLPVLAAIADSAGGAEDAILVAERWVQAMQEAALIGLPQDVIATDPAFFGGVVGTGGGREIVVQPGDTVSGLAAQYGMSQAGIMRAAGITDPRRLMPGTYGGAGDFTVLGDFDPIANVHAFAQMQNSVQLIAVDAESADLALGDWSTNLDDAVGKVTDVQTILQDISASIYKAEIELAVKDPNNILGILTGTAQLPPGISATTTIRDVVRDAGGRVPGASGRARTRD